MKSNGLAKGTMIALALSHLKGSSQYTFAAILAAALDVRDLPFQSPTLHILDDVDDLQAALRQEIFALHRKG